MRQNVFLFVLSVVVFALSMTCGKSWGAERSGRPNVLFIAVDDLRPELGCYGAGEVKSPHIDRLAGESLRFERAYCNVPVCGASRAGLMSGIYPTAKRYVGFTAQIDEDSPGAVTLGQSFKMAGYTTISNGKILHVPKDSEKRSWSEPAWRPGKEEVASQSYDPTTIEHKSARGRGRIYEGPDVPDDAYTDGQTAKKTIEDLRRLKQAGKPFFLACGFIRPHMPFYAPKKYWDLYDREKIPLAENQFRPKNAPPALVGSSEFQSYYLDGMEPGSEEFHRVMRHGYLASVSYTDQLVGNVLKELEDLGLADTTIIVLWGDHGWHLGEHTFWGKHNTMDLAMRVPLMIKVPGKPAGVTSSLVETVQLFPTLCELAGLPTPPQCQAKGFTSLFSNPRETVNEHIYCRYGSGDAVVTDRYAFTRYRGKQPAIMLYDHQSDAAENNNVADDPEYASVVKELQSRLNRSIELAESYP